MQIKFYKKGTVWFFTDGRSPDERTAISGAYTRIIQDNTVAIIGKDNNFSLFSGKFVIITDIQKSETPGDNYTSVVDFLTSTDEFFRLSVVASLNDESGEYTNIQNPLPINTDSIYASDLDLPNCDNGDFSGSVEDYFNSLKTVNSNILGTNPKTIKLWFKRSVYANVIGLGCDDLLQNFSQNITIYLLGSGEVQRLTVVSTEGDRNSRLISFPPSAFNGVLISFETALPVGLSNLTIRKTQFSSVEIQGTGPTGRLNSVRTNLYGNLLVSLDEQKDAFGRLKIAEPFTIFDSSLISQMAEDLFWSYLINGTGNKTYDKATSKVLMNVPANGDYIIRQTKQRFKYQPGKSHEFLITGQWPTISGVRSRAGLIDYDNYDSPVISNNPQNGVFFENNAGVLSWNIVNNGVITEKATQDQWNLDTCDGNGFSGFEFNPNSTNILACQLEWLGVGVVVVGFATGIGTAIYCHAFKHASVEGINEVYMRTANLPVAYSLESLGGTGSMKAICCSIISGGGFNPKGVQRTVRNLIDVSVNNGVTELLIGIRLQPGSIDMTVIHESLSVVSRAKNDFSVTLALNPIYTGTVVWVTKPNSSVQYAVNNNNVVTDLGLDIFSDNVSGTINSTSPKLDSTLRIGKGLNNDYDELWLIVTADDGADSFAGAINYRELI